MRVAVVGHIEWVQFARVERVPEPGEIVSAVETWEEPAGGGAVAAVQLANLNGSVDHREHTVRRVSLFEDRLALPERTNVLLVT